MLAGNRRGRRAGAAALPLGARAGGTRIEQAGQERRLIDIVRVEHIAVAAPALDPPIALFEGLFGFRLVHKFASAEGYIGATLDIPGGGRLQWEVIAPSGEGSYLYRFLGTQGAGLHHIAVSVPDAGIAAALLRDDGLEPAGIQPDEVPPPDGTFFIHPRSGGNGFLYQVEGIGHMEEIARTEAGADARPAAFDPADDDDARTLGVIAVNHLSHAHGDLEAVGGWYERVFGLHTRYRSPGDGLETGFTTRVLESWRFALRFEVIQPSAPASFIQRFLDRRGPGMHHVAFEVGNWSRAVNACALHGIPIFGERFGETDGVPWREAFIHPRHTGGILIQFFWQGAPNMWI